MDHVAAQDRAATCRLEGADVPGTAQPEALVERTGRAGRVVAMVWPRGQAVPPGTEEVRDTKARGDPTVSLLIECGRPDASGWRAVVHGYGAACAEEMELWDKAGLVLVGAGRAVVVLDAGTGAVRMRVPAGGYFGALFLAEDGRDAFVCGDEQVVRLLPAPEVAWKRTLGVDGVLVHRAVGLTVFCSSQKRVGGPWVDYLLDRATGAIQEAPDPEDEGDNAVAAARATAQTTAVRTSAKETPVVKRDRKTSVPDKGEPEDLDDENAVRMVRDDEHDPDED